MLCSSINLSFELYKWVWRNVWNCWSVVRTNFSFSFVNWLQSFLVTKFSHDKAQQVNIFCLFQRQQRFALATIWFLSKSNSHGFGLETVGFVHYKCKQSIWHLHTRFKLPLIKYKLKDKQELHAIIAKSIETALKEWS